MENRNFIEVNIMIKEILEEDFKDDPLLREIRIHNLEEELYTEEILGMDASTTYSTTDAAKIIGRHDSTIRNYFRTDLIDYIEPEKLGKHYRLNYKSIFKLKMILLLIEKANKNTADLAYYCGLVPLESKGSYSSTRSRGYTINQNQDELFLPDELQEEIEKLKKMMVVHSLKWNLHEEEKKLSHLNQELRDIEYQIQMHQKDLELLKIKKQQQIAESKYYKMLDHSLRNTTAGTKVEKRGIFSILFGANQKEDVDIDSILQEAEKIGKQEAEKNSELDDQVLKLQGIIKEKEKFRKELLKKIEIQSQKVNQINESDFEKLTYNPSDSD